MEKQTELDNLHSARNFLNYSREEVEILEKMFIIY